jgi:hypothetical protein
MQTLKDRVHELEAQLEEARGEIEWQVKNGMKIPD